MKQIRNAKDIIKLSLAKKSVYDTRTRKRLPAAFVANWPFWLVFNLIERRFLLKD